MNTINQKINNLISVGVDTLLNKDLLKPKYIDEVISLGFLIIAIMENINLMIEQKIMLERLLQKINIETYNYEFVDFFNTFHYMPANVYNKDEKRVKTGIIRGQSLIDLFRLRILSNSVSGSSEDEYFFSRGKEDLLRGIKNFFNHSKPYELNSDGMYYLFLNYVNTILTYEEKDYKFELKSYDRKEFSQAIEDLFLLVESKGKWLLDINDKLFFYNIYVKEKFNDIFARNLNVDKSDFEEKREKLNKDNLVWFFNNLSNLNRTKYKNKYQKMSLKRSGPKLTRYKERAISAINDLNYSDIDELNLIIPSFEIVLSRNWFKIENYIKKYLESFEVKINDSDVKGVLDMNDNALRYNFSKVIKNINPHIVLRESKKPHGPHEISDMELPIEYEDKSYYLCIPFKSGLELKGKEKPAEKHLYQILKPFTHFGYKTIVLYVSAKEGTEYFYNAIKRMNLYDLFYIENIMGEALVKLFKINGII